MKSKIDKNSLMFKTMSTLVFFSILILLLLYMFQLLFSNFYYENHKIKEVNNIAKNIDENTETLDTFLKKASIENDVCIEYLKPDSKPILFNENNKGCLLINSNAKVAELKETMYSSNENTIFYKITNPVYNSKSFLYGKRLSNGTYIFINSQLESLDRAYIVLQSQLIYLLVIVIFLAIIISFFVSDSITHPILEITKKAKKMGEGKLNVEFARSNISEIDELAETLNFAKNEMIKTDDYRRDLMANVGHDLKTPLTLIKSYAEMVRDITYKDEDKRTANLNVIIAETDRLNALVDDILTLSKIEANADTVNLENYDLITQIKEIIEKFEILSWTENYHFIFTGPENAEVRADRSKINQVIYNLLGNAINYTGDDATVYINVSKKKEGYLIEIIDTGKGIDKETAKHVWDRYYKTDKKHKRNKVGTGLGLSIVKGILESHGFEYGVKSTVGKGTNFYFTIKK